MTFPARAVKRSRSITIVMARIATIVLRPGWYLALEKFNSLDFRSLASIVTLPAG